MQPCQHPARCGRECRAEEGAKGERAKGKEELAVTSAGRGRKIRHAPAGSTRWIIGSSESTRASEGGSLKTPSRFPSRAASPSTRVFNYSVVSSRRVVKERRTRPAGAGRARARKVTARFLAERLPGLLENSMSERSMSEGSERGVHSMPER
jgi:hypothetical protein